MYMSKYHFIVSNTDEITSPHLTFNSDTAIVLPTTPLTNIFKVLIRGTQPSTSLIRKNNVRYQAATTLI